MENLNSIKEIEDADLARTAQLLKDVLEKVERKELEKIILFHYLNRPTTMEDIISLWQETDRKIGNVIRDNLEKDMK